MLKDLHLFLFFLGKDVFAKKPGPEKLTGPGNETGILPFFCPS